MACATVRAFWQSGARISQPDSSACCGGDVGAVLRGNKELGVALWVTFSSPRPHFGNLVYFRKSLCCKMFPELVRKSVLIPARIYSWLFCRHLCL